jgi:uncharacterized protein with HEPN domain
MSEREWRFCLADMIAFSENVLACSEGFNQAESELNRMRYDAMLRNLELIGEAATHVPDEVCNANPAIPRRIVIACANG